jgi:hypothetical protein
MTDLLPDEEIPEALVPICERLADEGVPIRATARALRQSTDAVRETVQYAMRTGRIAYYPKDDWPPGAHRDTRTPHWVKDNNVLEQELVFACVRLFKVTKLQGALLAVLINRTEVTKDTMHQVIESRRSSLKEETDPKMVDVVICHLRKRLKPFTLTIHTLWARGYYIEPAQRKHILNLLDLYISGKAEPEALKTLPVPSELPNAKPTDR